MEPDKTVVMERQVDVRSVSRLAADVARALGEMGVGGTRITECIGDSMEAECLGCGMQVSGAELIAAGLSTEGATETSDKLKRLRLGYCARRTCRADFYRVCFRPAGQIDWEAVWRRIEPAVADAAAVRIRVPSRKERAIQFAGWLRPRLVRPLPIGLLVAVACIALAKSGCRVPLVSPKPRVFIVPGPATPALPGSPGGVR